jgi:hypothetical protein
VVGHWALGGRDVNKQCNYLLLLLLTHAAATTTTISRYLTMRLWRCGGCEGGEGLGKGWLGGWARNWAAGRWAAQKINMHTQIEILDTQQTNQKQK